MIKVRAFDPHTATPAEWAALHAFRRQRGAEDWPGKPTPLTVIACLRGLVSTLKIGS